MTDLLVRRDDLRRVRVQDGDPPELRDGEALLRVDLLAVTANTVTYGVTGDGLGYWAHFPACDGWGRVPAWGFAEVQESRAEGVEPGTRLYGYLPPSSHVVVLPDRAGPRGFTDAAPHRAGLPSLYARFAVTAGDPLHRPDAEDLEALLRPLFLTAFLLAAHLRDDGATERGPVVLSSASSKTAVAIAHRLAQDGGAELVGLTSPGHRAFVEGLGLYDRVAAYDEVDGLEAAGATLVDVAGNGEVRAAVHRRLGDRLASSVALGFSHWEHLGAPPGDLPGPEPAFFFAPEHGARLVAELGAARFQEGTTAAWHPFVDWVAGCMEVRRARGIDGLRETWLDVVEGRVPPSVGRTVALGPGA